VDVLTIYPRPSRKGTITRTMSNHRPRLRLRLIYFILRRLRVHAFGVDFSAEAIKSAGQQCGSRGVGFDVGDVLSLLYKNSFDCAFVRSFSFYNRPDFESTHVNLCSYEFHQAESSRRLQ
jgi:hypothetical protein